MSKRPSLAQLMKQLQTIPFFQEVDPATMRILTQNAQWREYDTGEVVILEGDALAGLYYLQYGWLKVVKVSAAGREQILRFLEPGEVFNELGVFTDLPNPATAVALEPVGIWLIRRERLLRLLEEKPLFAQQIINKMAERLLYLVSLVTDLSLQPVTGRLARLLLDDADNDVLYRPRWYTQAELAARLGTVPDVVQRVLRTLEGEGLIKVERHQIHILDRKALEEMVA